MRGRRPRPALAIPAALLIVMLAGLMFLTGCNVLAGVDTNVNADGSGTIGIRLAADKELQDALSGAADGLGGEAGAILGIIGDLGGLTGGLPTNVDDLFNLIVGQIPGDWKVDRGTDSSGARWLSLTRSFSSPEELQQILSGRFLSTVIATDQFSLTQDKGFFTTKTQFAATADAGSVTSRAQSVAGFAESVLGEILTVQNRVTLPGTIKDNNADEVRGNTLVWNLGTSGSKEMYANSTIYNAGAIAGTTIAGVVIIAALTVALVLILRRRRRKPTPEQPGAVQPAPSSPPQIAEAVGVEEAEQTAEAAPESAAEAETPAAPVVDEAAETPAAVTAAVIEEPAVAPAPTESPAATAPPAPAGPAATTLAQPAAAAEAPRPIVPIPLRPTRAQAVGDDTLAVSPDTPAEPAEPAPGEGAAST